MYLRQAGFTVYPTEFVCNNSNHPFVDIAAKMGAFYWAFEYKSENDSISRGIEQVKCYADWFDYVVLVSERLVEHTRSRNFWRAASCGAGLWSFHPEENKLFETKNPVLQNPDRRNRTIVSSRFRALCKVHQSVACQRKQ
jgi:hypothetical protein